MNETWALIQDGVVIETTDIDPTGRFHPDFVWVEADAGVEVGDTYEDGEFAKSPGEGVVVNKIFSVRDYIQRFTLDEQIAVRQAQFTDMQVGLVYDDFNRAQFIDLDDPAVEAGIDLYISKGLISPDRKAELLAPEIN
jgi:hypothetical protein